MYRSTQLQLMLINKFVCKKKKLEYNVYTYPLQIMKTTYVGHAMGHGPCIQNATAKGFSDYMSGSEHVRTADLKSQSQVCVCMQV